ncbi:hypothetical protein IHE44_0002656 [Lamprotornis superbus]|uniref:Pro-neuregulin-4, membrane-bound isoform n=1 Tax=Lamprotornis superbus TaxID=245042 RepID=A0A835P4F1_9PASS|nr:hypothetical protein IHE44_0002656 [Lamprotornis superbus]
MVWEPAAAALSQASSLLLELAALQVKFAHPGPEGAAGSTAAAPVQGAESSWHRRDRYHATRSSPGWDEQRRDTRNQRRGLGSPKDSLQPSWNKKGQNDFSSEVTLFLCFFVPHAMLIVLGSVHREKCSCEPAQEDAFGWGPCCYSPVSQGTAISDFLVLLPLTKNKNCCRNNMRTDHEELCGTSYGSFCLNGGICYMIPTVSSPFCRCIESYTGARCEEVLLPSIKSQTKGDLFAAFLASLLLLGVLVIGAFYFLCRKVSIPRTSSSECGANLVETTSSNGCNRFSYSDREATCHGSCLFFAFTTQRERLVSQRHRKCELNNFLFNLFLVLEAETSKKAKYVSIMAHYQAGEKIQNRFLISERNNLKIYKNKGAEKMLNKLLFLGCLQHAVVSEKAVCTLYQCRQQHSGMGKKRHLGTVRKGQATAVQSSGDV